jgi:signal transduction histidine kinase
VIGNGPQLRRLLLNLLDNAIKYTPDGGGVSARTRRHDGRVAMIIEDTGVGIAAEHLARVRERFYRADPSRDHAVEGTGLGLSICQAIAEAHGGELLIESEAGRGTRCSLVMSELHAPGSRTPRAAAPVS